MKRVGHRARFHTTELKNITTLLVCDGNFQYSRIAREAPLLLESCYRHEILALFLLQYNNGIVKFSKVAQKLKLAQ